MILEKYLEEKYLVQQWKIIIWWFVLKPKIIQNICVILMKDIFKIHKNQFESSY